MEIEQGISTQRLRLSRLVTGLLVVVAFLSAAPFSCAYRTWLRRALLSILTRAEYAAQCLVMVQARILAVQAGVRDRNTLFAAAREHLHNLASSPEEDLPSFRALRRRLRELQAVLANLPRYALRLLRRLLGAGTGSGRGRFVVCTEMRPRALRLGGDVLDRPPDKGSFDVTRRFSSPGFPVGGVGRCAAFKTLSKFHHCGTALHAP